MKNPVKVPKKANSARKTTQKSGKKAINTAKTPRKRRKNGNSDIVRAFMMAGVLIVLSAAISTAVIIVRSSLKESSAVDLQRESTLPVIDENKKPTAVESTAENSASSAKKTDKSVVLVSPRQQPKQERSENAPARGTTISANTTPAPTAPATASSLPQRPPERAVENLGTLVFMIDDAGNNLRELEPFLRISGPLTIAVLPGLPNSAEAARRIRAAGKEVFLHQPMEAIGAQDPGPGAIYSGMNAEEIRAILKRNVAEVGPIAGINNHQGSKITMDREAMQTILSFCAENNLHFLDSRTTAETVVPVVAVSMGMRIGERNVFLDNEQDRESMLKYVSNGLTRAQKSGSAVMIGHTWSPELAPLLAEQFPILTWQGYTLKTASDIIR